MSNRAEIHKSVEFAYPSSETATKLGFGKSGCHVLYICHKPIFAHRTRKEVLARAESIPAIPYEVVAGKTCIDLWNENHIR